MSMRLHQLLNPGREDVDWLSKKILKQLRYIEEPRREGLRKVNKEIREKEEAAAALKAGGEEGKAVKAGEGEG